VAAVIKRQVIKLTLCGQSATSYFVFLRQNWLWPRILYVLPPWDPYMPDKSSRI
jgi:hypothetical protein